MRSWRCPAVVCRVMGQLRRSATRCSVVVYPPRERPRASRSVGLLGAVRGLGGRPRGRGGRRRRAGGRARRCCPIRRSSRGLRAGRRSAAAARRGVARCRPAPTAVCGCRRPSSYRTGSADPARERRCVPEEDPADDRSVVVPGVTPSTTGIVPIIDPQDTAKAEHRRRRVGNILAEICIQVAAIP